MASKAEVLLIIGLMIMSSSVSKMEVRGANTMAQGTWCVARSDASEKALQSALDYACGSGADCAPLQSSGLCFLPNTIQAHASYAFDSYYQRKSMASGSCDFAGTATVATTDPSYGSCVYPSSISTAGGAATPGTTTPTTNIPTTTTPTTPLGGTGYTPGTSPPMSTTDNSNGSSGFLDDTTLMGGLLFLVLLFTLQPMLAV
ncbi:X8 domain [Dillenia turbinata]|uniref:X8 domain n=1 Tax=Dillenia turbinata TaxID=194707 RepID=A0AAN8YVV9_9MAGN